MTPNTIIYDMYLPHRNSAGNGLRVLKSSPGWDSSVPGWKQSVSRQLKYEEKIRPANTVTSTHPENKHYIKILMVI